MNFMVFSLVRVGPLCGEVRCDDFAFLFLSLCLIHKSEGEEVIASLHLPKSILDWLLFRR